VIFFLFLYGGVQEKNIFHPLKIGTGLSFSEKHTSIEFSLVTWSCIKAFRGDIITDTPPLTNAGS
jgi:hypothetical protein